LKHSYDRVAAHILIGFARQILCDAGRYCRRQTGRWRRLKERQRIKLVILIVDDDKPRDLGMVLEPSNISAQRGFFGRSGVVLGMGYPSTSH
jgi:hypothetical protein